MNQITNSKLATALLAFVVLGALVGWIVRASIEAVARRPAPMDHSSNASAGAGPHAGHAGMGDMKGMPEGSAMGDPRSPGAGVGNSGTPPEGAMTGARKEPASGGSESGDAAPAMVGERVAATVDLANPECPVMGNKIRPGGGVSILYNGMRVWFCCAGCDADFLADPIANLRAIEKTGVKLPAGATEAAANPSIVDASNRECPVSGRSVPQDDDHPWVVHRGVRIGLCCAECLDAFAADPGRGLREAARSGSIPADRLTTEEGR
ncbi:MAG: hypothetical protein R3F20_08570 [Planctomycetota bacterium]